MAKREIGLDKSIEILYNKRDGISVLAFMSGYFFMTSAKGG